MIEFNAHEQLTRINQIREEALKSAAEQRKLAAEEQKLWSEATRLDRERWLMPWNLLIAPAGGVGLGVVQIIAKHMG
jgi:hypothetical protein